MKDFTCNTVDTSLPDLEMVFAVDCEMVVLVDRVNNIIFYFCDHRRRISKGTGAIYTKTHTT